MERVDMILRKGEIYLGHSSISTAFYQQREAVRQRRRGQEAKEEALAVARYANCEETEEAAAISRSHEAKEEALAVARYADCEETEENAAVTHHADDQDADEITRTENYVGEEAQLEAYIADEEALFNQAVAWGEEVEAKLMLEERSLRCPSPEYMTSSFFERCACEGKYGLDDDGEIAYHDDDCGADDFPQSVILSYRNLYH
jgi:hypothetical protein